MSFYSWLQNLRSALATSWGLRHHRRQGSLRAATHRPNLEVLENLPPTRRPSVTGLVVTTSLLRDGRMRLFALLSAADLVLTCWLLHGSHGRIYESNPVARWWLTTLGWAGLALFKAGTVLLAGLLLSLVARYRPGAARAVLTFGCLALILVVGYSCALAAPLPSLSKIDRDQASLEAEIVQLERELVRVRSFVELKQQLANDVIAGRRTLDETVEELEKHELTRDPEWLAHLGEDYPGQPLHVGLRFQISRLVAKCRARAQGCGYRGSPRDFSEGELGDFRGSPRPPIGCPAQWWTRTGIWCSPGIFTTLPWRLSPPGTVGRTSVQGGTISGVPRM
jgi:Domain of unknown function (DUF5658)